MTPGGFPTWSTSTTNCRSLAVEEERGEVAQKSSWLTRRRHQFLSATLTIDVVAISGGTLARPAIRNLLTNGIVVDVLFVCARGFDSSQGGELH